MFEYKFECGIYSEMPLQSEETFFNVFRMFMYECLNCWKTTSKIVGTNYTQVGELALNELLNSAAFHSLQSGTKFLAISFIFPSYFMFIFCTSSRYCFVTRLGCQISEWMVSHEEFEVSDSDYVVRIDLMTKVFGIDAAERYFEGLPPTAKTSETYTALLHSYAAAKLIEKAEALYERAKEANLSLSALTYNEMMTLYMSVGQVEKVPSVIEELKSRKVAPDLFTYNLWISSCAATMDIDGVKSILAEMIRDFASNEGWVRYANLANIYITLGHLVNLDPNSLVESEKGTITQREWITYDFLIILYAGLGNKEKLDKIWKSLRMTKQKMTSRNYLCVLSSYLMLGQLREAGEVIDQWIQSAAADFDVSTCNRLLKAFKDAGLVETGETLLMLLTEKGYTTNKDE